MPYKNAADKAEWRRRNADKAIAHKLRHEAKKLGVTVDELVSIREENREKKINLALSRLEAKNRKIEAAEFIRRERAKVLAKKRQDREAPRQCRHCGHEFIPNAKGPANRKFCDDRCRERYRYANNIEYRNRKIAKSKARFNNPEIRENQNAALRSKRAMARASTPCLECGLPLGDGNRGRRLHRPCFIKRLRRANAMRNKERYYAMSSEERRAWNKRWNQRHSERYRNDPEYRMRFREKEKAYRASEKSKEYQRIYQCNYRNRKALESIFNIAPILKEKLNDDRNTRTPLCPDRL